VSYATWDHNLGGCESGFTIPDPTDWNIVWASCYGNKVTRYDARVNLARNVEPWFQTLDSPPNDSKYRCHWTAPLAIDPFDHAVYYGCQVIFKTINNGQSWTVISPDLSTGDKSRIVSSGGIIGDNLGQFYGEVVFSIAPSPIAKGLIWAGTNDGQIWVTQNGGGAWTNVTKNVTGMPAWGTVREISPGNFDAGTAYVSVDYHIMDNRDPFIYKTEDFGKTWKKISDAMPKDHPLAYAQSVAENPNRKGMVFAGTGNAFYYTMDDGAHWTQLQDGLPQSQHSWIIVPKLWHDVVVSTYGRGIYILHDITTLEQADKVPANAAAYLYEPRVGYRQARSGRADLQFMLKDASADSVKVEILSGTEVVRSMRVAGRAGLNRATWDLHYDAPERVALRTTPPDNAHIWDEPRFRGRDTRPITHWGIEGAIGTGPLATPGRYSVRLIAAGQTLTQPLEVIKDPTISSSDLDLTASTAMQVKIRNDMTQTAQIVNNLEVMRKTVEDLRKSDTTAAASKTALGELDQKMLGVELQLLSRTDLHSDDKWFVEKYRVYMNLIWFNGQVGTGAGDVAGGADYRPTDTQVQVLGDIERDLAAAKVAFDALMKTRSRVQPEDGGQARADHTAAVANCTGDG